MVKAEKKMDKGCFPDALVSLRAAAASEPQNPEPLMLMSELYTDIGEFTESNYLIFEAMRLGVDLEGEDMFALACNFLGLQDYTKTEECLNKYLICYPEGEYALDAAEMLEITAEEREDDSELAEVYAQSDAARRLLDDGRFDDAVKEFERLEREYPKQYFLSNNLSLAYFCKGDEKRALDTVERVLLRDPANVYARCNRLLFLRSAGEDMAEDAKLLSTMRPKDPEDLAKLALTLCDMELHEEAFCVLTDVLFDRPFDKRFLYLTAAAAANTGRLEEALEYFLTILKLDPDDTVSLYYRTAVQRAIDSGEPCEYITYYNNVPDEELTRRMLYLNEKLQVSREELRETWRTDRDLRTTLLWALGLTEPIIKRAILEVITGFGDDTAKRVIRHFLQQPSEPDSVKHNALLMLKRLDEPEPYVAYIGGKFVEVHVGAVYTDPANAAVLHSELVVHMARMITTTEERDAIPDAVRLLADYLSAFKKPPVMRNLDAWGAAFLFCAMDDGETDIVAFGARYGVGARSIRRCVKLIDDALDSLYEAGEYDD